MEAAAAAAAASAGFPLDFRGGSDAAVPVLTSTPLKARAPDDAPLDLSTSSSRAAAATASSTAEPALLRGGGGGPARDDASRHAASSQEDARSEPRSETNDDFSIDLSVAGDTSSNPASPGGTAAASSSSSSAAAAAKGPAPSTAAAGGTPAAAAGFVPNKRYRTQMSSIQIRVMKSVFADYRTPTMTECEVLGREISLPRRVVQVSHRVTLFCNNKHRRNFVCNDGDLSPPLLKVVVSDCHHQFFLMLWAIESYFSCYRKRSVA